MNEHPRTTAAARDEYEPRAGDFKADAKDAGAALMHAAAAGDAAAVEALLRGGAKVEARRADGMTALMVASFFGHADVAALLLEHGADVGGEDRTRTTALGWSQARGHTEISKLLKQAAARRRPAAPATSAVEPPRLA